MAAEAGREPFPPLAVAGVSGLPDQPRCQARAKVVRRPGIPEFEDGFRRASRQSEVIETIAAELEGETLGGEIVARRQAPGGYPEFLYRPPDATRSIGLGHASSMVTELAPMVLFLRDGMAWATR